MSKNPEATLKFGGIKMLVHELDIHVSRSLLERGEYEAPETGVVRAMVTQGMTALDIGAHVGYYSALMAYKVGEAGQVFSFEPDTTSFALLSENMKRNNFSNVVTVNAAASDHNRESLLYLNDTNKGDHRLWIQEGEDRAFLRIQEILIDDYLGELSIPPVDFVKIDVQGWEAHVLRGMSRTIEESKKMVIMLEYSPDSLKALGTTPVQFFELTRALNLTPHRIGGRRFVTTSPADLEKNVLNENRRHVNLFFAVGRSL